MTDYIGYILQGLFTGVGVWSANYLSENHIRKKLKSIENRIKKIVGNR